MRYIREVGTGTIVIADTQHPEYTDIQKCGINDPWVIKIWKGQKIIVGNLDGGYSKRVLSNEQIAESKTMLEELNTPRTCKRCEGILEGKCAFPYGTFDIGNWHCVTMFRLRELITDPSYNMDQNAGLIKGVKSDHVLLTWYKSRGKIHGAWMVLDGEMKLLTLEEAEAILEDV